MKYYDTLKLSTVISAVVFTSSADAASISFEYDSAGNQSSRKLTNVSISKQIKSRSDEQLLGNLVAIKHDFDETRVRVFWPSKVHENVNRIVVRSTAKNLTKELFKTNKNEVTWDTSSVKRGEYLITVYLSEKQVSKIEKKITIL